MKLMIFKTGSGSCRITRKSKAKGQAKKDLTGFQNLLGLQAKPQVPLRK
jgi:hypothetical protein